MKIFLMIALSLCLLTVLGIMGYGMFAMAKGDKEQSNKFMRYRVFAQGAAVVLMLLIVSVGASGP